jgi:2-polyprenyl-3-methyl-5-hydroxy-6-metoxy-1,4-benzoquinol methylase
MGGVAMSHRFAHSIVFLAIATISLAGQSAQEVYERFRAWFSQQLVEVQRSTDSDLEARYRAHLKQQGLAPGAVDVEIRIVNEQGKRLEVERWNRILTAEQPRFNTNPNGFMVEMVKGRKPGKALDVGMGQGRNALWLAQQGWDVTGFDPAERAVALARENAAKLGVRLTTEIKGYEEFDFGEDRWDLILLSYVGGREMKDQVTRSLKAGGIVILEAFHRDATKGTPIGPAVVFDTAEVPSLFRNLRVVRYEEPLASSDFGQTQVRLVRYCAEKPLQ